MPRFTVALTGFEQRLAGNAADPQTRAAERSLLFRTCDVLAKLAARIAAT